MSTELQVQESQQLAIQVDIANKYPRVLDTFVDDVYNVVIRDPAFALSCVYCVPVGKGEDGSQTFAMGPSVRLSEEMQKYWKHLRVAVNCEEEKNKIILNGLIFDCESNNAETLTAVANVSGWSDRRKELKLKAMQSVMKRDLRISIMGKSYADELIQKIINGMLSDRVKTWNIAKGKFALLGVPEKTILNYFKVAKHTELTAKQIYQTIGMYNFLKENNKEPAYLFGGSAKINSRPKVSASEVIIVDEKEDFENTVHAFMQETGFETIDDVLFADFSIQGGIKSVPENMRKKVLERLEELRTEQPGA